MYVQSKSIGDGVRIAEDWLGEPFTIQDFVVYEHLEKAFSDSNASGERELASAWFRAKHIHRLDKIWPTRHEDHVTFQVGKVTGFLDEQMDALIDWEYNCGVIPKSYWAAIARWYGAKHLDHNLIEKVYYC